MPRHPRSGPWNGMVNDRLSFVYSGLRGNVFTTNSKRSFVFIPYFVHETCQCLVSSICFQSLRHKIQVYTFEYECRTTEAIFRASDIF